MLLRNKFYLRSLVENDVGVACASIIIFLKALRCSCVLNLNNATIVFVRLLSLNADEVFMCFLVEIFICAKL